jgi:HEAT repeat protein
MERPESSLSSALHSSDRPESALGSALGSDLGKKPQLGAQEEEVSPGTIAAQIVELLKDAEPNVRASAADALARMTADGVSRGDPDMQAQAEAHAEAVGALLTDNAPGVRRAAIEAVGIMAPPGPWMNDVQFLLEDPHPGVRRAAECVFQRLQADGVTFEPTTEEEDADGGIHTREMLPEVDLEDDDYGGHEFEGSETEGQHEGSESEYEADYRGEGEC